MLSKLKGLFRKGIRRKALIQNEEREPGLSTNPNTTSPTILPGIKHGVDNEKKKADEVDQMPSFTNAVTVENDQLLPVVSTENRPGENSTLPLSSGNHSNGSAWERAYKRLDEDLRNRYLEVLEDEWKKSQSMFLNENRRSDQLTPALK